MKHLKLFENFDNSQKLDEKVQSEILRTIIKSDLVQKIAGSLDRTMNGLIDWANLKDSDFQNVTPKEARGKKYENSLLFWFNGSKLIAASNGKYVYHSTESERQGGRRFGRIVTPSSKALADMSDSVLVLVTTGSENRRATRDERFTSKDGALALKNPRDISDDNNRRYRSLVTTKKTATDNIDELVKTFMNKYTQDLSAIPMPSGDDKNDVYSRKEGSFGKMNSDIKNIQLKMHNLLNTYEKYLNIVKDAGKSGMYAHQEPELKEIREMFKKWKDAGEVDQFNGQMTSRSALRHHRRR